MGNIYRLTKSWARQSRVVEADCREDAERYAAVHEFEHDVVDLGADRATRQATEAEMVTNFVRMGLGEAAARVAARGRPPADPLPLPSVRVPPGLGRLSLREAADVLRGAKPMPSPGAPASAPLRERESPGHPRVRAEVSQRQPAPAVSSGAGRHVELRESDRRPPELGSVWRPDQGGGQGVTESASGRGADLVASFRAMGLSEEAARVAAAGRAGGSIDDAEELTR